MNLTAAQHLKFKLFAHGLSIGSRALSVLTVATRGMALSSDDFASTSGIILRLEGGVWVNAPISAFNPNFVHDSVYELDHDSDGFFVRAGSIDVRAQFWPQPAYHGSTGTDGRPLTDYVVTHGDRARLSPLHGCGMVCTFCDVPYGVRYATKRIPVMIEALQCAFSDPIQPAHHLLISGGTPREADFPWLQEVYRTVLTTFPTIDVDIMMVPSPGLLDVAELQRCGVHQLSINLELYSDEAAKKYMPQKFRQGRGNYLDFIEKATEKLGPGCVRSMLMVGLEPPEQTLMGVRSILERGGVPVLSPFRPDPTTPLRSMPPPCAELLLDTFLRASELAEVHGAALGPSCVPCTHNTLTLPNHNGKVTDQLEHLPFLV